MAGQTSYTVDPPQGRAGGIARGVPECISRVAEGARGAGLFVVKGTTDAQATAPAAAGDITGGKLLGVTKYDASKEPNVAAPASEYKDKDMMPIVRKGIVWVPCETACTYGAEAFIRHTASGGNTILGKVRNDSDTNTAAVESKGAVRFMSTLGAAGLAMVEVNLP